jgi:hypothetical protein
MLEAVAKLKFCKASLDLETENVVFWTWVAPPEKDSGES